MRAVEAAEATALLEKVSADLDMDPHDLEKIEAIGRDIERVLQGLPGTLSAYSERVGAGLRDHDQARAFLEVVDAQRGGKTHGTTGGEHVARARGAGQGDEADAGRHGEVVAQEVHEPHAAGHGQGQRCHEHRDLGEARVIEVAHEKSRQVVGLNPAPHRLSRASAHCVRGRAIARARGR